MTKEKALSLLRECDHAFLSKSGVEMLTKPFGFMGTTFLVHANPNDFKGLSLTDGKGNAVDQMEGQDAAVVAEQICRKLRISYPAMYGRGSQLQVCCDAIARHLGRQNAKQPA